MTEKKDSMRGTEGAGGTDGSKPPRRRRIGRWLAGAIAVVGVLAVAGPFVYINFFREDPPPPLSFDALDAAASEAGSASDASAEQTSSVAGEQSQWSVVQPSQAGYRVDEVLSGQSVTAVGRTETVDGTVTIEGTTVTAAEINVDLASITSDSSRRDGQFRGRIMNTEEFPVATFVLSSPVELTTFPGADPTTTSVKGTLSLHGTEKPVTLDVSARMINGKAELTGSLEIVFEDWGIPNPSIGPVRTEDRGLMEFAVSLAPA